MGYKECWECDGSGQEQEAECSSGMEWGVLRAEFAALVQQKRKEAARKRAAESALEKPTSPLPPCGSNVGSKRQKAAPAPKKKNKKRAPKKKAAPAPAACACPVRGKASGR